MRRAWSKRDTGAAAGFAFFAVLMVLAQIAAAQAWDAPNMDRETLPPLLRIVSTVGLLVGTWFLLASPADRGREPE